MTANPRLNRLFGPEGKCLDVALDHGVFNEPRFLDRVRATTATIVRLRLLLHL